MRDQSSDLSPKLLDPTHQFVISGRATAFAVGFVTLRGIRLKIWSYSHSHRIEGDGVLVEKTNKLLETCEVQGLSPDTVRIYAFNLMAPFKWLNEDWNKFEKFDQKKHQDWMVDLKEQELKPRSINNMFTCARGFYRYCFGQNLPHAIGVMYSQAHYKRPRKNPYGLFSTRRKSFLELKVT